MNLLHLKYAVEVARTRSITMAAENLYMGQPRLSRAIKELEDSLGITIFKRTAKGIVPTPEGEIFLTHANRILDEVREVETLYNPSAKEIQRMNISIPRAGYLAHALKQLVGELDLTKQIEINYRETNSLKAINNILQNNYNLGIIRFAKEYEPYFERFLSEKGLRSEDIWEFDPIVLLSESHMLAEKEDLTFSDLVDCDCVQLGHGDPYVPSLPLAEVRKGEFDEAINKHIFIYERASGYELLSTIPATFLLTSPLPEINLKRYGLVQRRLKGYNRPYKDLLIRRENYKFTELDLDFIREIKRVRDKVGNRVIR